MVSPDTGGAERARAYAKRLDAGLALCDKRREKANEAQVMNVVGDVRDKNCLIIDDMCDTGGTICKVAEALHKNGAKSIKACFVHAVLSGKAADNIRNSHIEKVIVTNTIPLNDEAKKLLNHINQFAKNDIEKAAIQYILWKLDKNESQRKTVLELYTKLYQQTPKHLYQLRINKLTNN